MEPLSLNNSISKELKVYASKSNDMPRHYTFRMKYFLKSYKTVAVIFIILLIFGLVVKSWGNFSLAKQYSFSDSLNVSFVRRYLEYGIMFDAGSTGTRIHVFSFKKMPDGTLNLEDELFEEDNPGLSSYADKPKEAAKSIYNLLQRAKDIIPLLKWHSTPVALKATAGLRLLPVKASKRLLREVYKVFRDSPFDVPKHQPLSVSIMDGLDEGIFAWVTVNFLTGSFHKAVDSLFGALDLGGGSTQVTFHPLSKETISYSPNGFTQSVGVFGHKNALYSHSYLGLGLMSARADIMSQGKYSIDSRGQNISHSPCLPPRHNSEWVFGGKTNKISGHPSYSFDACLTHAKNLVKKVDKQDEMNKRTFYTFSYYYDRAVELGLIDLNKGGTITVGDYIREAEKACSSMAVRSNEFLCLDATYIIALLKYGYGFHNDRKLILRKKIDGVEVSWALGATLDMFNKRRKKLRGDSTNNYA